MAYPYVDPDPRVFATFTRQLEISYQIQEDYNSVRGRSSGLGWESILHGLHHIKLIYNTDYAGKIFTDCMALNYETALYAGLHHFQCVNCIALRDFGLKDKELLRKYHTGNVNKIVGRFQV